MDKEVSISLAIEEPLVPAMISRVGFDRMLENLLRNAIDAVPEKVGHVEITLRMMGDRPTLIVRDDGVGVPTEILERIFDFDFTTKEARGTGLGLGIVKKLCSEYGAEFQMRNISGERS